MDHELSDSGKLVPRPSEQKLKVAAFKKDDVTLLARVNETSKERTRLENGGDGGAFRHSSYSYIFSLPVRRLLALKLRVDEKKQDHTNPKPPE